MSKTTIVAIRVTKEQKQLLEQLAQQDKRTLSNFVKLKLDLL